MSSTGIDTFDRAVHKANQWVGEVVEETGWKDRHRALEGLMAVLQVVRDRLPVRSAVALGARLPALLRGLYYQNWEVTRCPLKYRKEEAFFERVRAHFRSEVDAPALTRAVIRVVARRLAERDLDALRRALPEGLRELWPTGEQLAREMVQSLPRWYRREQAEKEAAGAITTGKEPVMGQTIREVMSTQVESARPDMTIREAAAKMKEKNIGSLPVCEDRQVVGIVTDRDLAIRALAEGRDPEKTTIDAVMTRDVVTCKEDAALEEAEKLMHDHQIRRIPVVNASNELVGYLAMAKVARTENPNQAGRILKGISQASKPRPMESFGRRRKTG